MKAVGYQHCLPIHDPLSLQDIELPQPQPLAGDVLVEVRAVSVNPVDTKIRSRVAAAAGEYKILGWDAAGVVRAVGSEVINFKAGDEVWYAGEIGRSGSNAQMQCVDQRLVALKPKSLDFAAAAALPLTALTAWELLFERLQLPQDERSRDAVVLVTGAAGGVGSVMLQLLRQLTAATVIGTASRPQTHRWVLQMGAHHVLDHSQPLSQELKKTALEEVMLVASVTNTQQHFAELVKMLRPQGRLALIDDPADGLDIKLMKQKSLSLHWEFMFTRPMFRTADMRRQQEILANVASLVDAGRLRSTQQAHYGRICAENLKRAHRQIESGGSVGKIVLEGF